jgi:NADH dehydrogenase FAD-containing subunit
MAEYLWDAFDVTIIDKKDHFEYVASSLKCTVDEEWTLRNSVKFDDVLKGYQGRIKFQQGELVNVHLNDIITIKRADMSLVDIPYDILLLCTGYIYDPPVKEEKVISLSERRQNLKNVYDEIKNSKSVLVVGGGLAGVELVSELCCKYPDKKLAITTQGSRLLNGMPGKAHTIAENFLRKYNVEMMYNTAYMDEMRNDMDYEVVIKCTGQKFCSDYLKENFPYCRSFNGMILTNEYM